jgi:hypothetical protein
MEHLLFFLWMLLFPIVDAVTDNFLLIKYLKLKKEWSDSRLSLFLTIILYISVGYLLY